MSTAARQHRRDVVWRSLAALPILALLVFQFLEANRIAGRRVGIIVPTAAADAEEPMEVLELAPGGPAELAGVRVGDVIRFIEGHEMLAPRDFDVVSQGFKAGLAVEVQVRRGEEVLALRILPGMPPDWGPVMVNGFVALLYLAMALMTIEKRPGSVPSRLLYWLFVLVAAELSMPEVEAVIGVPLALVLSETVGHLIPGLQFGTELHLVSLIPRRPVWLRLHPWLVPLFYAAGLFVAALVIVTESVEVFAELDVLPWTYQAVAGLAYGECLMIWSGLVVAILAARVFFYSRSRGRLRAGIVLCGVLPWTLYIYVSNFLMWIDRSLPFTVGEYLALFSWVPYPISIFVMLRLEDEARNQVLRNLIEEVQEAGSIAGVSRLISEKLNLAFYTKCNYVFFREQRGSEFTSTHISGSDLDVERIPNDYEILEIADRKGDTLAYPSDITGPLPAVEKEWLDNLQASLIVPIVESEGHMMGLLILGQKRSEEPYTPDDLELLHALARQIAVAHENLALQLKVQDRERIQRQVLDRLEGEDLAIVKECPACGFCYDTHEEACPRDGSELTLTLPVERLIDGHYRLEQVLGRGGAAVVYLANDVRLNRGVAVKVLALSLLDDVVAPRRFEREARVSAQLVHPNIVTTHDFGKTRNGLPYMVMEHLEGRTLRQVLRSGDTLGPRQAADWFGQILDGLGAAHALGVVHRDLKPDNVFVVRGQLEGEEDVVKLLDFGLAKIPLQSRTENFTSPGMIMGTLSYMAPEQLAGRDIDQRTDLYSVGVMAFEVVTGRRPFEGRSPAQILTAIMKGSFEFPDEPQARALRETLERCFQQERKNRPGSAAKLRAELIPALQACPRVLRNRKAPGKRRRARGRQTVKAD